MRGGLVASCIASCVAFGCGCSLFQDFDRYSASFGEDASIGDDSGVLDSGAPDAVGDAPFDAACPSGQIRCGACVPEDREHCGSSCTSCEAQGLSGAVRCVAGKCECASGATKCGATCTYLDADPLHCKACGAAVADSSQTCVGGTVACAGVLRECKPWGFDYGGSWYDVTCPSDAVCIDIANDGNHCTRSSSGTITRARCYSSTQVGVCVATACSYHSTTSTGACTGVGRRECAVNTTPSDPNVRSCVDELHDPNHCGGCNQKCTGKDQLCAAGTCRRYRPARSSADCGAGFRFCAPFGWSSSVCIEGVTSCP
ncbi:MAG: hypothetical protein HYV09_23265 [Deltaproteobacteria bacterium]|nr:hypothetical protein [Deltaproteobacteria bacterium]